MFKSIRRTLYIAMGLLLAAPSEPTAQPALDRLFDSQKPSDKRQPPKPRKTPPAPGPAIEGMAEWTILVYWAGDNNLDNAALKDVREMEQVGSTREVKVVCFLDRSKGWRTARRALIVRNLAESAGSFDPAQPTCEELGEVNSGDPETLTGFIQWAAAKYPARRYGLVLCNHGGGWRDLSWQPAPVQGPASARGEAATRTLRAPDTPTYRTICEDATSKDSLYTAEVRQAIEKTGLHFDLIGCDACLMGMIEVAYEWKDLGDVFVASEESEPNDGWEYTSFLRALTQSPQMDAEQIARRVVSAYQQFYDARDEPDEKETTLSAVRLSEIAGLREGLNNLCSQIAQISRRRAEPRSVLDAARGKAGRMGYKMNYVDLGGFLEALGSQIEEPRLAEAARSARQRLEASLVCNYSRLAGKATGLTIFFPEQKSSDPAVYYGDYTDANLQFARDGFWDEFVRHYAEGAPLDLPTFSGPPGGATPPTTGPSQRPSALDKYFEGRTR
jgi:hypothetical protein